MSDRWEVGGVTDSLVPASFSVNVVRFVCHIEAEISVAPVAWPARCRRLRALMLLEDGYPGQADGSTVPGTAWPRSRAVIASRSVSRVRA
jgi:hypothetical protein